MGMSQGAKEAPEMERKIWTIAAALTVVLAVTGVAWAGLPSTPETTTNATIDNELVAPAGDAGMVTLRRMGDSLEVAAVDPAAGWQATVEVPAGPEVEVTFRSAQDRVDFNAELENGQVRIRVRVRAGDGGAEDSPVTSAPTSSTPSSTIDDSTSTTVADTTSTSVDDGTTSTTVDDSPSTTVDHDTTSTTVDDHDDTTSTTVDDGSGTDDFGTKVYDVDGIGTVTVERDANGLTLVAVVSVPGWTIEVKDATADEIEVEFRNGDQKVEFKAEIEDGQIRIEIRRES